MSNSYTPIDPFEMPENVPDFHAVETIQLCELVEGGFLDWSDSSWKWDYYSEEQYERVCRKFNNRYWMREISIIPPGLWKIEVLRKFNEIMPKYKLLYKALEDGAGIMQVSDKYGKSRHIYSDFPETMLSGNEDYASAGNDREFEDIENGDTLEKLIDAQNRYNDIDVMILDEFSTFFSFLFTSNVNGY